MFCKKCGKEVADGTEFCPYCGTVLTGGAPARPAGGPLESVRANPLFFAAVICMSVVAFFQLIGLIQGGAGMASSLGALTSLGMNGIANTMGAVYVLVALVELAIVGVILAGLWMTWASGLDAGKAPLMAKGLKLIGGGLMANLIYSAVAIGLALLVILLGMIGVGSMGGSYDFPLPEGFLGGMVLVFILLAAVLVLMVFFYLHAIKTVKQAQAAVETGYLAEQPSMFLVVVTFVVAGCTLLRMLFGGFGGGAVSVLNDLANIGAYVLFGLVMLQMRGVSLGSGTKGV